MKRNSHYPEYQYDDPGFIYIDVETGVLRNKLLLTDSEELEKKEREITNQALIELYLNPIEVRTMEDVRAIHRFLFETIYEWAGEYREVDIGKGHQMFIPLSKLGQGVIHIDSLLAQSTNVSNDRLSIIAWLVQILEGLMDGLLM